MSDTLVTVAGFPNVMEAEIARQALEQEGIRSYVQESESATLWGGVSTLSEVRLEVLEEDQKRARRLLEEMEEPAGRHRHRRHLAARERAPGEVPEDEHLPAKPEGAARTGPRHRIQP